MRERKNVKFKNTPSKERGVREQVADGLVKDASGERDEVHAEDDQLRYVG